MSRLAEVLEVAATRPDERLLALLEKRLTDKLGIMPTLLRPWIEEEQRAGAERMWKIHESTVTSHGAILDSLVEFRDHLIRHATLGINDEERAMLRRADEALAKAGRGKS